MFGNFSTISTKGQTEHYLDAAFIPIKSQCKMAEWSFKVKTGLIHADVVSWSSESPSKFSDSSTSCSFANSRNTYKKIQQFFL